MDINIIIMIFIENLDIKYLKIRGEWPQLKVSIQALQKFSLLFSLSLSKEH